MAIFKVTVKSHRSDNTLIETEIWFVEKKLFRLAKVLFSGLDYEPGGVFPWYPLKNHVKPFPFQDCDGLGYYKISVERTNPERISFVGADSVLNIVALTDALELLKILELATRCCLTSEPRQKALAIIEQVQSNSQGTLQDIFEALLLIPELEQFALTIKEVLPI